MVEIFNFLGFDSLFVRRESIKKNFSLPQPRGELTEQAEK